MYCFNYNMYAGIFAHASFVLKMVACLSVASTGVVMASGVYFID